jgi:hypothetical protein
MSSKAKLDFNILSVQKPSRSSSALGANPGEYSEELQLKKSSTPKRRGRPPKSLSSGSNKKTTTPNRILDQSSQPLFESGVARRKRSLPPTKSIDKSPEKNASPTSQPSHKKRGRPPKIKAQSPTYSEVKPQSSPTVTKAPPDSLDLQQKSMVSDGTRRRNAQVEEDKITPRKRARLSKSNHSDADKMDEATVCSTSPDEPKEFEVETILGMRVYKKVCPSI